MNSVTILTGSQNQKRDTSAPSSENRMLTPCEIKSLQQDKREAAEKGRAFFRQLATSKH